MTGAGAGDVVPPVFLRARIPLDWIAGILILALCHAGVPHQLALTESDPETPTISENSHDAGDFVAWIGGSAKPTLAGAGSKEQMVLPELARVVFPRSDRGTTHNGLALPRRPAFPHMFLTGIVELRL